MRRSPAPADAGPPHAARDDGGVARHAAAHRQNALGGVHAVNVLGAGLDAHQDDRFAAARRRLGLIGREHDLARGGAGRGRQTARQHGRLRARVEHRVQ